MVDNTAVTNGAGDVYRSKDRAGVKTDIVGIDLNIGGTETLMAGSMPTKEVALTQTTGSIVAATTTVTASTDVPNCGAITVAISGTYAGMNVAFEASLDGSVWVGVLGQRTDSYITETTSGVLTANTTRAWDFPVPGFAQFRVRATAWTSGTGAVTIAPTVAPFEIAPTIGWAGSVSAAITSAALSASSFTVLAANTARRGASFYNDSVNVVYLATAATASTTAYTVQIPAGGYYEPASPVYIGLYTAIALVATGNVRVTELS